MPIHPPRLFGIAEATALLPNLREIFAVVRPLRAQLMSLTRQLEKDGYPPRFPHLVISADAPEQVRIRQRELIRLAEEIERGIAPLNELGAEVKGAEGLVDFPSRFGGRVVYLCWHWDDDQIAHFHEEDAGFAGRRPIEDPEMFEGDLLN